MNNKYIFHGCTGMCKNEITFVLFRSLKAGSISKKHTFYSVFSLSKMYTV